MKRILFFVLGCVAFSCFADYPVFVSSVRLSAPPTTGRTSADGKRFVTLLQAKDKQPSGLQVVDMSDILNPKLRGFLAISSGELALSEDGNTALLLIATEREVFNKETNHEIAAIDLTDPNDPKELWHKKLVARKVILSASANAYAYSKLSSAKQDRWVTYVNFVKGSAAPLTIEEDQYSLGGMQLSPHAKFLVSDLFGSLRSWDLRTGIPMRYEQEYSGYRRYECISAVLDDGRIIATDSRLPHFGIYESSLGIPRIATLRHDGSSTDYRLYCDSLNPTTPVGKFIYPDGHGRLQQIDFRNPQTLNMGGRWEFPAEMYPIAAAQNILFAVTGGGVPDLRVYRLDTGHPETVDWQSLSNTHLSIMSAYNADMKAGKPIPYFDAISRFEKAGILRAVDAPVKNISPQKAAAIINDYGFLAIKKRTSPDLIDHILRRAIELDPERALAHLNFADYLRDQLSFYGANRKDVNSLRKEIEEHYRAYLRLGGKRTSSINAFLAGDSVLQTEHNVCAEIAAYTNVGRLGELLSSVGTNIPYNGRKIDLVFTTEGTAHVPTFYAFDSKTDFPLKDSDMPSPPVGAENAWGGDEFGLLTYHNEGHILFYKDLQHPTSSISLVSGEMCSFGVTTSEKIGPSAAEHSLCVSLQKNDGPPEYEFYGDSPMERDDVSKTWGESEISGTQRLDIANDGKLVNVAELEMTSGAGAGCDETFYDVVNSDATQFAVGPARDLLMKLQGAMPTNRYPILPCGNKPRFFQYKNRLYFETKPKNWPPIDKWNQYHRVTTIIDGDVRDVCDFQFETTVTSREVTDSSSSN